MSAAIVVAVILLTSGGGGSKPKARGALPAAPEIYSDPALRITGRLPADWTALRGPGFLRLLSNDHRAVVAFAAPAAAPRYRELLPSAVAELRKLYRVTQVKRGSGRTVGGRPASSVVVYATNSAKRRLRILIAAARGRRKAYLLETFTDVDAPARQLVEAQEILLFVRFAG